MKKRRKTLNKREIENEKKEGKVKSEEEEGKGYCVILDHRFSLLFLICGNEII